MAMQKLSKNKALELLRNEQPIVNFHIFEPLSLNDLALDDHLHLKIQFRGCRLHSLCAIHLSCHHPLILKNTVVSTCNSSLPHSHFEPGLQTETKLDDLFLGSYFHAGLLIEGCTFGDEVAFFLERS